MGCTQSVIENEENVNRCKERRRLMERAVAARSKFAGAHSAYATSLKNTGAALSDFAMDEVVISGAVGEPTSSAGAAPPLLPYDNVLLPPPPPPDAETSSSLQRASTMPEFRIPRPDDAVKPSENPIVEDDEGEADDESVHSLKRRSFSSSKKGVSKSNSRNRIVIDKHNADDSEEEEEGDSALNRRRRNSHHRRESEPPPPMPGNKGSLESWDFFFETENVPGPTLADVEENRAEREEIERKMLDDMRKRESEDKAAKGKTMMVDDEEEAVVEKVGGGLTPQPPPLKTAIADVAKRGMKGVTAEMAGKVRKAGGGASLLQVFVELDDCFLKASESTHEVSKMLEATRLHYHSNFADKRGSINHSERVMRVITWNKSLKGSTNGENGIDEFDAEKNETLATVLDKILAWEKKLYEEVKVSEQMKFEYKKKAASLNRLSNRSSNSEALERKKAAVSYLHTRHIVGVQSTDSSVSEINRLRDEQLFPKLVSLVDGMSSMWESMRVHHERQSSIVQSLKSLDTTTSNSSPRETTERHHSSTKQLATVVRDFHSSLTHLVSQQREHVDSLHAYLNLGPPADPQTRPADPPVKALIRAWHEHLGRIRDGPAREGMSNFAAAVEAICEHQKEEMEARNRCADSRRELERKARDFDGWCRRRTIADVANPEGSRERDELASRRGAVEAVRRRLEEEEEGYRRMSVQVRKKGMASLRGSLPEMFRALSEFSMACSDMYGHLRIVTRGKDGASNGAA